MAKSDKKHEKALARERRKKQERAREQRRRAEDRRAMTGVSAIMQGWATPEDVVKALIIGPEPAPIQPLSASLSRILDSTWLSNNMAPLAAAWELHFNERGDSDEQLTCTGQLIVDDGSDERWCAGPAPLCFGLLQQRHDWWVEDLLPGQRRFTTAWVVGTPLSEHLFVFLRTMEGEEASVLYTPERRYPLPAPQVTFERVIALSWHLKSRWDIGGAGALIHLANQSLGRPTDPDGIAASSSVNGVRDKEFMEAMQKARHFLVDAAVRSIHGAYVELADALYDQRNRLSRLVESYVASSAPAGAAAAMKEAERLRGRCAELEAKVATLQSAERAQLLARTAPPAVVNVAPTAAPPRPQATSVQQRLAAVFAVS